MASFDLPEIPQPRVSPALLVGVASPLWSYFAAAAAGGVAYWWMTQWARPVNLEALLGVAKAPLVPVAALAEPAVEAAEAVADVAEKAQETVVDAAPVPVGGEAAPVSPLLETLPLSSPEPVAEPEPDAVPESFAEAAPSPSLEPASEPGPDIAAAPEAVMDAAAEPVIAEPAPVSTDSTPKARGKKTPSSEA